MGIGVGGHDYLGTWVCMGVMHVSPSLHRASPGGIPGIQQFVSGGDIIIGVGLGAHSCGETTCR